jgi:hypothetical protein
VQIQAHEPSVIIDPFWREDAIGIFTPDRVWVESPRNTVLLDRPAPRGAFAGHNLGTRWDKLHELYFTSYSMWNYLTTPFLLTEPGFEILDYTGILRDDDSLSAVHRHEGYICPRQNMSLGSRESSAPRRTRARIPCIFSARIGD